MGETLDEKHGEFAEGIVARAHDDDAVAVARLGQQRFADRGTIRDMFRLAARSRT
ncbi:hypothetical protein [Sphingomonas daechungensis]|uniref:hypothetical protein n=1 Tax=Sphingomonas daechungensis TaxID=1176646 RepID=UPI0037DA2129